MKKSFGIAIALLALAAPACTTDGGTPISSAGSTAANISRAPIDFALHSFDAALYAFDFAMDTKFIPAGSDRAKQIAAAGRKVLAFLNAAEAARDAGSATSYEEAFRNANKALAEFRALLGPRPSAQLSPALTPIDRQAILARAG